MEVGRRKLEGVGLFLSDEGLPSVATAAAGGGNPTWPGCESLWPGNGLLSGHFTLLWRLVGDGVERRNEI